MSEEELAAATFFGYTSHKFCGEVHAICYNEYLRCVSTTKDKLQAMYPDRNEEIQEGCTNLLMGFSHHLNENVEYFLQYYQKNIHTIPSSVPVYGVEIEESRDAGERLSDLKQRIVAVNQLNHTLSERVTKMEKEIHKREALLHKMQQFAERKRDTDQAKIMLEELRSLVDQDSSEQ